MVYVEINGVRLDQVVLTAIGEGLVAHGFLLMLLATVNMPCVRPRAPWLHWLRGWRTHVSIYAVLAIVAEALWVQMGLFVDSDKNAMACPWTLPSLNAWATLQLMCLICLTAAWSFCQRAPVAPMVNGVVATHATGMMGFAMLGMYERGACGAAVFPMLAASVGMLSTCCCVPWYGGAWWWGELPKATSAGFAADWSREHSSRRPTAPYLHHAFELSLEPPPVRSPRADLEMQNTQQQEEGQEEEDGDHAGGTRFVEVDLESTQEDEAKAAQRMKLLEKTAREQMHRNVLTCWGAWCAERQRKRRKRKQRRRLASSQGEVPMLALSGSVSSDSGDSLSDTDSSIEQDADTGLLKRRRGKKNGGGKSSSPIIMEMMVGGSDEEEEEDRSVAWDPRDKDGATELVSLPVPPAPTETTQQPEIERQEFPDDPARWTNAAAAAPADS